LDSLLKAGLFITRYKSNCHVQLPGWTEYVSDLYDYSKTCHQSWLDANEPRQGFIHNIYIRTRARFKYALRSIKRNEEQMRKESMAKNLSDRKIKEFWKEVSITNNCKTPLPDNIDEANGSKEIVDLWKKHFQNIFNCIKSKEKISDKYNLNGPFTDIMVNGNMVTDAIKELGLNKSS
jgi:hypothetical protein